MIHKRDMNKEYSIAVWDIQFYKIDADGNELLNKDGSVKLFNKGRMNFSWVANSANVDELVEIEK